MLEIFLKQFPVSNTFLFLPPGGGFGGHWKCFPFIDCFEKYQNCKTMKTNVTWVHRYGNKLIQGPLKILLLPPCHCSQKVVEGFNGQFHLHQIEMANRARNQTDASLESCWDWLGPLQDVRYIVRVKMQFGKQSRLKGKWGYRVTESAS